VHVLCPANGAAGRRAALREALAMGAMGIAAWAAVVGYFAASGRLNDFLGAIVRYNRYYAPDPLASIFDIRALAAPCVVALAPLLPFAAASVAARTRGRGRSVALVAGLAAGSYVAIALPGKYFDHYFQLWLVPATIAFGWGASVLGAALAPRGRRLGDAAAALALAGVLAIVGPAFRLPPEEWARAKHGIAYADTARAARAIEALLAPGETVYIAGFEVPVYFETRRRPPSGVLYPMPLLGGPVERALNERVIADLAREKPELVYVPVYQLGSPKLRTRALEWCMARYDPLPDGYHGRLYALLALRGGALERRLRRAVGSG
jgi:hypothetical protein